MIFGNPVVKFAKSTSPSDAGTPSELASRLANITDVNSLIARARRGKAVRDANPGVLLDKIEHLE
jgi:hypothetical protein